MRGLSYHQRPRSLEAQVKGMSKKWEQFEFTQDPLRPLRVNWRGTVRGAQKLYLIQVYWDAELTEKPYVVLRDPPLRPRDGMTFDQIPHLLFWSKHPELSGLCLFDPNGREWSNKLLIADTTIPWAGEWIFYYEQWHVDGVWRGGGVGPESIAEARSAALHREAGELTKVAPEAPPLAV